MASSAPVEEAPLPPTGWLPSYGWWPRPEDFSVTVVLSPYHATADPQARFHFILRGYAGSSTPVWERDLGVAEWGREMAVRLDDLDLPEPPEHGGILEVHSIRVDQPPPKGSKFVGMWIDAQGRGGGGYLIPTIPIQGAGKLIARDDLQVMPGVMISTEIDTEVLLLNPTGQETSARLNVSSPEGLITEGRPFALGAWSAWHGRLSRAVPRSRRLLEDSAGVGSLSVYTGLKVLPYFALRKGDHISSMDHAAPIFA